MDRQGKECDLKQDTEKAKRLFNVMESKDFSSREIQKDLCNVITLFNHSLTSWKKISGEEHFKVQMTSHRCQGNSRINIMDIKVALPTTYPSLSVKWILTDQDGY